MRLDLARALGIADRRVDDEMREVRLVVAEAHDQEGFRREVALQAIEQRRIILRGHALTAQIFVDIGRVAEIAPVRRQLGPQPAVPGKVIGDRVDEEEQRPAARARAR